MRVRSNESSREEAPKVTKSKKLCHSFSISPKGSERKGEGEVSLLTGEEREAGTVEKSLFYRVFPWQGCFNLHAVTRIPVETNPFFQNLLEKLTTS